jgi:alpha-tubulin suppressor-like RCC1 family protein
VRGRPGVLSLLGGMLLAVAASSCGGRSALPVPPLPHAVAVSTGRLHACALLSDGSVWCWGHNDEGELGDGTTTGRASPAPVPAIQDAKGVVAGSFASCARLADDTLACWGDDGFGELGNGVNEVHSLVPVPATVLAKPRAFALGGFDSCALSDDGSVACLGYESGIQNSENVHDASAIAIGADGFACAVYDGGKVACWGDSEFGGQYGNGSLVAGAALFANVEGITNATAVAPGGDFVCARLADRTVRCWGSGPVALGPGVPSVMCMNAPCVPTPATVEGLDDVIALSAGIDHICALRAGGTVACWGANDDGGLGDGTTNASSTPVVSPAVADAVAVSAGWGFTCALDSAGNVTCWGRNLFGELGDGTTEDALQPVAVTFE